MRETNKISISNVFITVYTIISIIINIIAIIYLPFVENFFQFLIWIAVIISVIISIPLLLFYLHPVLFIRQPYEVWTWDEQDNEYILQPSNSDRTGTTKLGCIWELKSKFLHIWVLNVEIKVEPFVELEGIIPSIPLSSRKIKKVYDSNNKVKKYIIDLNIPISNYFSVFFLPKIKGNNKKRMTRPLYYQIETKIEYKLKSNYTLINYFLGVFPSRTIKSYL